MPITSAPSEKDLCAVRLGCIHPIVPGQSLPIQPIRSTTYPSPRRNKLVNRHVGLTQAYELRDTASEQANEIRECPATTLEDKATRAQALRNLASVWEVASERIRIIKGKPMPGSLRPVAKPKKVRLTSTVPLESIPPDTTSVRTDSKQSDSPPINSVPTDT